MVRVQDLLGIELLLANPANLPVICFLPHILQNLVKDSREVPANAFRNRLRNLFVESFRNAAGNAGQRIGVTAQGHSPSDGVIEVLRCKEGDDRLRHRPLAAGMPIRSTSGCGRCSTWRKERPLKSPSWTILLSAIRSLRAHSKSAGSETDSRRAMMLGTVAVGVYPQAWSGASPSLESRKDNRVRLPCVWHYSSTGVFQATGEEE